jgi:hypothetical protein
MHACSGVCRKTTRHWNQNFNLPALRRITEPGQAIPWLRRRSLFYPLGAKSRRKGAKNAKERKGKRSKIKYSEGGEPSPEISNTSGSGGKLLSTSRSGFPLRSLRLCVEKLNVD